MVPPNIKMETPSLPNGNPRSQKGPEAEGVALKILKFVNVRENSASSGYSRIDPGLFEMWIFLRDGKSKADALSLLDREIARLGSDGPRPLELEKAINQLELSFLHGMETAGGKAEQIGFYETVANDGAALFDRLEAYREVTCDDVKRAVTKYLRPSRRTRVEILRKAS